MDDVVLVTADSVRHDYADEMAFVADGDVVPGIAAAHYTRPSLAALHSSSYLAAARTEPVGPTVAETFADAGYTCIGLAPTPQMDPAFGFGAGFDQYESFYEGDGNALERRTSSVREFFGQFDIVRRIYRQFNPMGAVLEDIPADARLVDEAIERFNAAEPPRFLWLHLMETHRPYGTGEEAVPVDLDRRAEALGGRLFGRGEITNDEHDLIDGKYRDALGRCDDEIRRLVDSLDSDPVVAFTSDHGEELGEAGYYYHQGYRRRVPETVVRVPVAVRGVDLAAERCSLVDLPPTLLSAQGVDIPDSWQGVDLTEREPDSALTVAPWHDTATVLWQDFDTRIVCRDADISVSDDDGTVEAGSAEVSDDLEQRLQNLGYMDAG
jgi:arylsulfatase A-like enzyme